LRSKATSSGPEGYLIERIQVYFVAVCSDEFYIFCAQRTHLAQVPHFHQRSPAFIQKLDRRSTVRLIRLLLSVLSVSLLAILVACGGGGGTPNPVVSISGAPSTIAPNGTANLTATVTNDSTNSGVTWTLAGAGALSANTTTGVTYTAPAPPVPANPSVTITATSVADTGAASSVSFIIQQPAVQVPQYLDGQYAFVMSGFDSSGDPLTVGGSITADGNGHITDGVIDVNDNLSNTTTSTKVTGTYTLDSNLRGQIKITNALPAFSATPTFSFTLGGTTNPTTGTIISLDSNLSAIAGTLDQQQAAAFNAIPSGSFIFRAYSDNPQRASMAGRLSIVGGGSISNGIYDLADILNGNDSTDAAVSGTFAISDAHGRGLLTLNLAGNPSSTYTYYAVSASKIYIFENNNNSNTQMVGQLRTQALSSLNSSSPNGTGVFGLIGGDYYTAGDGTIYLLSSVTAGNMVISGNTNASVNFDLNDAALVSTSFGGSPVAGTVTFDPTTGRGTIAFASGFASGFIDSAAFYLEAAGKGVMLDTTENNNAGTTWPEAFVGDLTPQVATSAISGTIQGVDLISESDIPVVATAGSVNSGNISALQDGAFANDAADSLPNQTLTGSVSSVSSTGRSVLSLSGSFEPYSPQFPAVAYAIDATHFYVIGTYGVAQDGSGGSTSSLAIFSTQTPPAIPAATVASSSRVRSTSKRKLPEGLQNRRHGVRQSAN
jgi:hypothetical protein